MADIKFSCPHCNQHITCDDLWGGHELQCPSCQGNLTVPARRAPVAAAPPPPPPSPQPQAVPPAHHGSSVVYKPPAASAPKLALGQAPAEAMAAAAQRTIPIRNLAAPPPKKTNPWLKYGVTALVVLICGAGGYFGFMWFHQMQNSANEKSRAEDSKNSGESQVGHIASLNSVLDATEPGHSLGELSERRSSGPRQRRTGVVAEIPVGGAGAAPGAMAADNSPVVPPAYTLDIAAAKIPDGRVNGTISGSNFVAEAARLDPVGSALVLRLLQGPLVSPDREVLIYLHLKPGEKLGGQSLSIASDMKGSGVPQVSKRWKMTPRSAPALKAFNTGYAMKLELGAVTNGLVAGKIFLALPDTEQTVVAGGFNANIIVPDPTVQATPTAAPTVPGGMDAASRAMYEQRYGIKR